MSIDKLKHYLNKNEFEYEEIFEISGDISTRKYFKILMNGVEKIACLNEKENKKHNELYYYWYEEYIKAGIRVPKIFHFENGFNIQEKIEETIFEKVHKNKKMTSAIYEASLESLLKIHSLPIDEKRSYESLDIQRFKNEFSLSHTTLGFEQYDELLENVILKELSMNNKVICHRDYHSRNILIEDGDIYIIDFQDSMLGNGIYDLVSITNDCYIQLPQEIIDDFKKNYFLRAKTHLDESTFLRQFDLYTIQRIYKAFGNFKSFYLKNNDSFYLKFIKPNASKILEIIENRDELSDLKPVFQRLRDEY